MNCCQPLCPRPPPFPSLARSMSGAAHLAELSFYTQRRPKLSVQSKANVACPLSLLRTHSLRTPLLRVSVRTLPRQRRRIRPDARQLLSPLSLLPPLLPTAASVCWRSAPPLTHGLRTTTTRVRTLFPRLPIFHSNLSFGLQTEEEDEALLSVQRPPHVPLLVCHLMTFSTRDICVTRALTSPRTGSLLFAQTGIIEP